jgi:hypothetical protein
LSNILFRLLAHPVLVLEAVVLVRVPGGEVEERDALEDLLGGVERRLDQEEVEGEELVGAIGFSSGRPS